MKMKSRSKPKVRRQFIPNPLIDYAFYFNRKKKFQKTNKRRRKQKYRYLKK